MVNLYFLRKLFYGAISGVVGLCLKNNTIKENYSRLNTYSSLSGYAFKFIILATVLMVLMVGCTEKKEKYEEMPKIGPFLEDELDNYKADDDLELIICTFEEITDQQKEILSNFGEIKESAPPQPSGKLIGTDYWRTILISKKRYIVNLSKMDFVDKIEKWPSKDSGYLDKAIFGRIVPVAIGYPNNKSIEVYIEFKNELGDRENEKLKKLGVVSNYNGKLPVSKTVIYTASIPVKNTVRVLRLDFVQSIEVSGEILIEVSGETI